jgi:hypothetical protein
MIELMRKAYNNNTAAGPDELTPDMILYAHHSIWEVLFEMLNMISKTSHTPRQWGDMRMIAHKNGRDPSKIYKGYRPIMIGSLLLKATETVIKRRLESHLNAKNIHDASMAYRKGYGHDMARYTIQNTILAAREEAERKNKTKPKLHILCIDIEHAFNGTWKKLVQRRMWEKHKVTGNLWKIAKNLSSNIKFTVDIHGNKTKYIIQEKGYPQGPTLSPIYYNISTDPILHELSEAGAGITIDGKHILGANWSDDMAIVVEEKNIQKVLDKLTKLFTKYKKKTNADKVHIIPMCRGWEARIKQKRQPPKNEREKNEKINTIYKLSGNTVHAKKHEIMLGFTLEPKIQGSMKQIKKAITKGHTAAAKIETMRLQRGGCKALDLTLEIAESMVHSSMATNLTPVQMTREIKGKQNTKWYEYPRRVIARVIRNSTGASPRTSAWGLIAETKAKSTDESIIAAKMRLHDRLLLMDSESYPHQIALIRLTNTDKKGIHYETKQLWEEAGDEEGWTRIQSKRRKEEIKEAAKNIAHKRMMTWIDEEGKHNGNYQRLWTNKKAAHLKYGNKREIGIMIYSKTRSPNTQGK